MSADLPQVVLSVTDYAQLPPADLASAQRAASSVYARAGIRLRWTDGEAANDIDYLEVVILTAAMTVERHAPPGVFGQASHETRHAFIHAARISAYASETMSDFTQVLGLVLAHEVGHMLLPGGGHSPKGLMRAEWEGRIVGVPDFLPAQVAIIRAQLAGSN